VPPICQDDPPFSEMCAAAWSSHWASSTMQTDGCAFRACHATLTPRQWEIMGLVISGVLNKQIAAERAIREIAGEGLPRPGEAQETRGLPQTW
jgi:FixJ family two-component response regulator